MNKIAKRIGRLSDEELHTLVELVDTELDSRRRPRRRRGYQRSTYMSDRVRGRRRAPRSARAA